MGVVAMATNHHLTTGGSGSLSSDDRLIFMFYFTFYIRALCDVSSAHAQIEPLYYQLT